MTKMSTMPKAAKAGRIPWLGSPEDWPALKAFEAWMDIGSEAWTFWTDRLHADVNTEHALLHCTNPVDAQVALMRHMHKVMEDYHREAGRMVQLLHTVPGAVAVMDE